jgi:hypothetical protein
MCYVVLINQLQWRTAAPQPFEVAPKSVGWRDLVKLLQF